MSKKLNNQCGNNCKHWKNNQSELNYSTTSGFCVCPKWKFGINNDGDVKILDRQNRSDKYMGVNRFESFDHISKIDKSRYVLVTEEEFGCIYYEK
jgi:hypothetical protein